MRKRIAILTLVVLMLITPFTSLAHAEVDTIRFRYMEWYITPEQFEENLRNEGLEFEMELLNLGSYWDWNTNDWKKEYSIHTSEHWYLVYEVKNPNEDSPLTLSCKDSKKKKKKESRKYCKQIWMDYKNLYLLKRSEITYQNLYLADSGTFHYPPYFFETEG